MSETPIYDLVVQDLGNPFKRKLSRTGGEAGAGEKKKASSKKGR